MKTRRFLVSFLFFFFFFFLNFDDTFCFTNVLNNICSRELAQYLSFENFFKNKERAFLSQRDAFQDGGRSFIFLEKYFTGIQEIF